MPGEVNRRGESEVFAEDTESNFRRALLWYAFGMAGLPVTSSSQSPQSPQSPLGRRLWWLIAGRAAAAVLLLLMAAAWKWNSQTNSINSSRAVTPLMLSVAGLTLAYCIARLAWKNFLAQARLQILFDVLLVTWLVWISGNVSSPYAALYIVIISVAGFFLGTRGALITSFGVPFEFNPCLLSSLIYNVANGRRLAIRIQPFVLSVLSFLVVGLLAAKLAHSQTTSDVQLAAATRS